MEVSEGPDRCWSWTIAFAACFCSFVLEGVIRAGEVLFVPFVHTFAETSWPIIVCIAVLNFTGLFSGVLGQKFGVRPIVILGAVLSAIGLACCFFATSINVITILFGGIFGVGCGLINTLIPVIVNAYFLNLRGLATGIAYSGSCFGAVIFPLCFDILLCHYGTSGCFLLIGAIVLNVVIAGALLRPPKWLSNNKEQIVKISKPSLVSVSETSNNSSKTNFRRKSSNTPNNLTLQIKNNCVEVNETTSIGSNHNNLELSSNPCLSLHEELVETLRNRTQNKNVAGSMYKDPSFDSLFTASSSLCVSDKNEQNEIRNELFRAQREFQDSLSDFQNTMLSILQTSQSEEILNKFDETDDVKTSALTDSCPARHSFSISSMRKPKLNKASILNNRPLQKCNLKFENSHEGLCSVPELGDRIPNEHVIEPRRLSEMKMENIEEEEQTEFDGPPSKELHDLNVFQSFNSVLSHFMFYVASMTNMCFYLLFYIYIAIIIDYSVDCGLPDHSTKHIIFAFSAADLFGRLCLGWITDRKYLTRSHFVMFCMTATGLIFFIFPFVSSYWTLIAASCGYGVLFGSTMIMFPILLVDFLGTELHAISFGCMCFLNGFTSFARHFLIGYFRDNMSYAGMFYTLGTISVFVASAWLFANCFITRRKINSSVVENMNLDHFTERHVTAVV